MTRQQIKAMAKAQLGNKIFGNSWMIAVVVVFIQCAISYFINGVLCIGQIVSLLAMGPITYGMSAMFLKQTRDGEVMNIPDIIKGFKEDFSNIFLIGLMKFIFTLLWSLLFVIPGIVKFYSYSMAYYIKADNPDYDWNQCLKESQRMMSGHKGELFVLDLSFIGWLFVGSMCLGVGVLWVNAYMEAAHSQFYENLRLTELGNAPQFNTQQV